VPNPRIRTALSTAAIAVASALALALAGCDSGGGENAATGGGPSVIAPGRPGEAASTLSASQAAQALPDDSPNQADLAYVRRMIKHHEQALVMTESAGKHAASGAVRSLAGRISAAQGPEKAAMSAWLKRAGVRDVESGHDHSAMSAMPGMATAAQLAELDAARGDAFDRLFLRLMITHHQGAVTMATEVLGKGNNVQVEEWANEVIAQQSSEIARMRAMR
jgi:uncharacterized protein (DUF305 family)